MEQKEIETHNDDLGKNYATININSTTTKNKRVTSCCCILCTVLLFLVAASVSADSLPVFHA